MIGLNIVTTRILAVSISILAVSIPLVTCQNATNNTSEVAWMTNTTGKSGASSTVNPIASKPTTMVQNPLKSGGTSITANTATSRSTMTVQNFPRNGATSTGNPLASNSTTMVPNFPRNGASSTANTVTSKSATMGSTGTRTAATTGKTSTAAAPPGGTIIGNQGINTAAAVTIAPQKVTTAATNDNGTGKANASQSEINYNVTSNVPIALECYNDPNDINNTCMTTGNKCYIGYNILDEQPVYSCTPPFGASPSDCQSPSGSALALYKCIICCDTALCNDPKSEIDLALACLRLGASQLGGISITSLLALTFIHYVISL